MNNSILQNPILLIGPAVLISVLGYLVRFFGKIIADQKPFTDNRGWEIELSGISFFTNFLAIPGAFGFALAHYAGSLGAGHWIHFIVVTLLGSWLLMVGALQAEEIYQIKFPVLQKILTLSDKTMEWEPFRKFVIGLNRFVPLWLFAILFCYILTLEYTAGDYIWLTVIAAGIFFNFILLALSYSLRLLKLSKVDVYLIGLQEPLRDLVLLKTNDDNIRLREKDKVVILNKSQVLKIEIKIDQSN